MSIKNYKFVSPGVFVNEIDNSQVPASPAGIGPVVIGRAESGPALRPVTVDSFSEFVQIFGNPSPGNANGDVWRLGSWNVTAPTYGVYAAQAYLRNSSPLTYIRLLGSQDGAATSAAGSQAGWDGGSNGNAWGLVVFEPEDWAVYGTGSLQGVLAAVFYTTDSSTILNLSGTVMMSATASVPASPTPTVWADGDNHQGANLIVKDNGSAYNFKMVIDNVDGNSNSLTTDFNFNVSSTKYLRKVFNTTPARTNSSLVDNESNVWLGESFDRHLKANLSGTAGETYAAIVNLKNTTNSNTGNDFRSALQSAQTPQIIGCDVAQRATSANSFDVQAMPSLFKVVALNEPGDWSNRNLKVSIQDIKAPTNESNDYGTFSLVVRSLRDSDNVVQVVEQFNDLNLNPESVNYVARKIGDKYLSWNATERRYVQEGEWGNVSDYIRVEMNQEVVGDNPALLPFGFKGMVKYLDESGSLGDGLAVEAGVRATGNWITGSAGGVSGSGRPVDLINDATVHYNSGSVFIFSGSFLSASILYPAPELRVNASDGNLTNKTDAYFGMQTSRTAGSTTFDASNIDLLRPRGGMVGDMFGGAVAGVSELSMFFTLDDVSGSDGTWVSGSHALGTSLTCVNGAISGVLDAGFDRFTVPLYAGFDGLDIRELDPFRNSAFPDSPTDANSYIFNSVRQSIDAVADPEVVEMNLATIPGLKQSGLTNQLINVCEDRADALAIIDLEGGFRPRAESTTYARNNTASELNSIIKTLRDRALNTSYACTFYPWLRCRDSINGTMVWLPPSVAALGTFSSSQKKTQVWFAPAGFNRGGLTEGAAGIPVQDVSHQLRRKDRDDLYAANINPIAKFPAEGIVIFGQKTLQITPSALDRINVRRLMIFLKKRISQVAATLLFDPNVQTTWTRFVSLVTPILADVKTNFGLSDYKLVLDETTTTPDLVDRNIMYAKIFLKPTRAIEYIAIDFNITRTGASFDD
jgi:hypothetical protein